MFFWRKKEVQKKHSEMSPDELKTEIWKLWESRENLSLMRQLEKKHAEYNVQANRLYRIQNDITALLRKKEVIDKKVEELQTAIDEGQTCDRRQQRAERLAKKRGWSLWGYDPMDSKPADSYDCNHKDSSSIFDRFEEF